MTATDWYAPNQQAVRPDGSGPGEQGDGGSTVVPAKAEKDAVDRSVEKGEKDAELEDDEPAPARRGPRR